MLLVFYKYLLWMRIDMFVHDDRCVEMIGVPRNVASKGCRFKPVGINLGPSAVEHMFVIAEDMFGLSNSGEEMF